jgi:hypothetical protein
MHSKRNVLASALATFFSVGCAVPLEAPEADDQIEPESSRSWRERCGSRCRPLAVTPIPRSGEDARRMLRNTNACERCMLVDVDLRGANLRCANLRFADLRYADLRGADLTCADLHRANLYGIRR